MEEALTFQNKAGEELSVIVARPQRVGKSPIVVLAHGYGSKKNNSTNIKATELLIPRGIATLRFDFSGHGESGGDIADLTLTKGVEEVKGAVYIAESFDWVDRTRVGLLGGSYGGNAMLLYTARFGGIKAMALKSPVSNYTEVRNLQLGERGIRQWKEQGSIALSGGIRSKYGFYEDAGRIDTYAEVKQIRCPVLVVQGDKDEDIPLHQAKNLAVALGDIGRMEIIQGANHGYTDPTHFSRMINLLVDFLQQYLRG